MRNRTADSNYQALAAEFSVGDLVVPYGASRDFAGRVVSVFPGIGMVDVQFPMGNKRYPVEEMQRLDSEGNPAGSMHDTVPGGLPTVSVSGGPVGPNASRVASAHAKQAIYWAERDRKYRASLPERESGVYLCPRCKDLGVEVPLRKASYRRENSRNIRLLGCPECMFLVRTDDIMGCHHPAEDAQVGG